MQETVIDAWAAGLFEGEGTLYLHPRTGQVQCSITMTDLDVLERFAAAMGGRCRPVRVDRSKYANTKPIYRWGSSGRPAAAIIKRMLPYLGVRRSAQARKCLAAHAERYRPRACPGCGREFEARRADQQYCDRLCGQAAAARRRYWADLEKHRAYARDWARARRRREVTPNNAC